MSQRPSSRPFLTSLDFPLLSQPLLVDAKAFTFYFPFSFETNYPIQAVDGRFPFGDVWKGLKSPTSLLCKPQDPTAPTASEPCDVGGPFVALSLLGLDACTGRAGRWTTQQLGASGKGRWAIFLLRLAQGPLQ